MNHMYLFSKGYESFQGNLIAHTKDKITATTKKTVEANWKKNIKNLSKITEFNVFQGKILQFFFILLVNTITFHFATFTL